MYKFFSLLLISLSACFANAQDILKYEADIKDFTELKVASGINVNNVCNPDSVGKAVFYSTEQMASEISFVNKKNKLTIEYTTKTNNRKLTGVPTVTVYSRFLNLVENNSDSTIRLVKVAPGPKLKLRLTGGGCIAAPEVESNEVSATITIGKGVIAVGGKCSVANLTSVSSGTIQADRLKADVVKCKLTGSGEIGCWPIDELYISMSVGMGSGTILYRGEPKAIKNYSAGIKVEKLETE